MYFLFKITNFDAMNEWNDSSSILRVSSNLYFNILFGVIASVLIACFSCLHDTSNYVDLVWGSIALNYMFIFILSNKSQIVKAVYGFEFKKHYIIGGHFIYIGMGLIFYTIRHILIYLRAMHPMERKYEDFRYAPLRNSIKGEGLIFWIASWFIYHLLPIVFVTLSVNNGFEYLQSVIDRLSSSKKVEEGIITLFWSVVPFFSVLFTAIADEQLKIFRIKKQIASEKKCIIENQIIKEGLWKLSRHPNYLGEITFSLGLWILSVSINGFSLFGFLGALIIVVMFIGASIPMMENRLLSSYQEEFLAYKKSTKCLVPYVY